jgi:hypothetical protein
VSNDSATNSTGAPPVGSSDLLGVMAERLETTFPGFESVSEDSLQSQTLLLMSVGAGPQRRILALVGLAEKTPLSDNPPCYAQASPNTLCVVGVKCLWMGCRASMERATAHLRILLYPRGEADEGSRLQAKQECALSSCERE